MLRDSKAFSGFAVKDIAEAKEFYGTTLGLRCSAVYGRSPGAGFETGNLQPDRGGIAQSIVGRMERNGGLATVTSKPAEGTEVHLRMPRRLSS